jgi:hypothetical protein
MLKKLKLWRPQPLAGVTSIVVAGFLTDQVKELAKHWAYSTILEHGVRLAATVYMAVMWIITNLPFTSLSILIVVVLAFRSFLNARASIDSIPLTCLAVYHERADPKQGRTWPSKIRFVMRNDSKESISLMQSEWVAGWRGIARQQPLGSSYQVEKGAWDVGQWDTENSPPTKRFEVKAGQVFRTWIGIDPGVSNEEVATRQRMKRLGTLVLPMTVNGRNVRKKLWV